MNIIICGAGQVGSHAAETLAGQNHNIVVVDPDSSRLQLIGDTLDVATLVGNAANAETLREAGAPSADIVLAATDQDELNLLIASVGKGVGAKRVIARVHHRAYFERCGIDYAKHLGIDHLICPDYSTANAIARTLRNPGALAIETYTQGSLEMQELVVGENAAAAGTALAELRMPPRTRVASIVRDGDAFLPTAAHVIQPNDIVVIVGESDVFDQARQQFQRGASRRQKMVIVGGLPIVVWLCRALHHRNFSVRVFETDRPRANELAEKLSWVTVLQSDPTDLDVFAEEHLEDVDAFVALSEDDEQNILQCVWAKSMGVKMTATVYQRRSYVRLMPIVAEKVGLDHHFSPRLVAAREIENLIDDRPIRRLSSLRENRIDIYRVQVQARCEVVGRPLRQVDLAPDYMITAIQRDGQFRMPTADDSLHAGDVVLVIGPYGREKKLAEKFHGK